MGIDQMGAGIGIEEMKSRSRGNSDNIQLDD